MPFLRGSSCPRDQTQVSCTADRFSTTEPPGKPHTMLTLVKRSYISIKVDFISKNMARDSIINDKDSNSSRGYNDPKHYLLT